MGRARRRGKSYAGLAAGGAALMGASNFISEQEKAKAQALKDQSLLALKQRELDADIKYKEGVLANDTQKQRRDGFDKWLTTGESRVAQVFGKQGMSELDEKVFLEMVKGQVGDYEMAKEMAIEQGLITPAQAASVSWEKLDKLYKGLDATYREYVDPEGSMANEDIQLFFPMLYGAPSEEPEPDTTLDPVVVTGERKPPLMGGDGQPMEEVPPAKPSLSYEDPARVAGRENAQKVVESLVSGDALMKISPVEWAKKAGEVVKTEGMAWVLKLPPNLRDPLLDGLGLTLPEAEKMAAGEKVPEDAKPQYRGSW